MPEFENVGVARAVVSGISILMCTGALFFIVILKRWKVFSQRLIMYLLTSALLGSLAALIDIEFSHSKSNAINGFCKFSGYFTQTASMAFLNAIFAVTVYLFFLIVLDYNTDKYGRLYFLGIFAFPLIITWIPFVKDGYGKSGVWCWIRGINHETCENFLFGEYLQYILYFVPVYLMLFAGAILYLVIFIDISRKQRKPDWVTGQEMQIRLKMMKSELLSLVAYPVIFAVLNIPAIVNRSYSSHNPHQPSLVLWYLSGIFSPLQGIFTAVAFTVGTKMWHNLSWFKIRAAFKSDKVVQYYPLGEGAVSDSLAVPRRHYATLEFDQSKV